MDGLDLTQILSGGLSLIDVIMFERLGLKEIVDDPTTFA